MLCLPLCIPSLLQKAMNHRCRLDPVRKHPVFDIKGIYQVKRGKNPNIDSTLTWRMILEEMDRITVWPFAKL